MRRSLYGPCGLFCGACPAKDCDGCLCQDLSKPDSNCKFLKCTKEKEIDFCCFCEDYPCKELHEFMTDRWPHHWTIKDNLAFIKEHGFDEWVKAQRKEWSCTSCGAEIMWYQKKCDCGMQLDAWDVPPGE